MKGLFQDLFVRFSKVLVIVLVTVPFALIWYLYYRNYLYTQYFRKGNWAVIFFFLILYVIFGKIYEAFDASKGQILEIVYSQVLAEVMSNFLMYIVIWLLTFHLPNPLPLLGSFLCEVIVSALWAVLIHKWYFRHFGFQNSVIVYDVRKDMQSQIKEYGMEKRFKIRKNIPVEKCLKDLSLLDGAENVFLSGIHSHDRNIILKYCVRKNICVYVIPRIGDVLMSGAKRAHLFHLPILKVKGYNPSPEYLLVKRVFDILASLIALFIFSPVFLVTAIAIKQYDGGTVFYKQRRLTKDGKEFYILKFRSMQEDAEKESGARLSAGESDERVTPVGRIIRRFRIDELPQLINILCGDLSICGPRPERPELVREYEVEIPEFSLRLQAKAGLTGYAQVYGKYNTTPYDKLQMDLMYISNPSFLEDLRIMFMTVKILFMKSSTEGVVEEVATTQESESEEMMWR